MYPKRIDMKQTRCNVREVLKNFRKLDRLVGRVTVDIQSPHRINSLKATLSDQSSERASMQMIAIEAERNAILNALMVLSLTNRMILYYSYFVPESFSNYKISLEIGYSERTIQRKKQKHWLNSLKHIRLENWLRINNLAFFWQMIGGSHLFFDASMNVSLGNGRK